MQAQKDLATKAKSGRSATNQDLLVRWLLGQANEDLSVDLDFHVYIANLVDVDSGDVKIGYLKPRDGRPREFSFCLFPRTSTLRHATVSLCYMVVACTAHPDEAVNVPCKAKKCKNHWECTSENGQDTATSRLQGGASHDLEVTMHAVVCCSVLHYSTSTHYVKRGPYPWKPVFGKLVADETKEADDEDGAEVVVHHLWHSLSYPASGPPKGHRCKRGVTQPTKQQ